MANYILRDLPTDMWNQVKARAQRDGWPLRALLLRLLEDFGTGRVTPSGRPPLAPLDKVFPPTVTQEPRSSGPPGPLLGPPPSPLQPQHPLGRVAVIRFRNRPEPLRVAVASAHEHDGNLLLFDGRDKVIGRFPSADVESWFMD